MPGSSIESQVEQEPEFRSRIALSFFRHGEKEKFPPPGLSGDAEVLLTPSGRKGAIERGEAFRSERGIVQAVAKGSPRKRTQETAAFVMAGSEEMITGQESLDELKAKIDEGRKLGSKIGTDRRLDFDTGSGSFEKAFLEAFKAGRLMPWLIHESDALALEVGETAGSTYSREAGNVAAIIVKYARVAPRFDQLSHDPLKKYQTVMERFLGTHQSVCESFLAKVIEKTRGPKERDEFIGAIGGTGFDFVEGFHADIDTLKEGEAPRIRVAFEKKSADGKVQYRFEEIVDMKILEEMIAEEDELDRRIMRVYDEKHLRDGKV